jgi:hypothetical protein
MASRPPGARVGALLGPRWVFSGDWDAAMLGEAEAPVELAAEGVTLDDGVARVAAALEVGALAL